MNVVVDWDESLFVELYPQFANTTSTQLEMLWEMACSLVDNTENSLIPFDPDNGVFIRRVILFALVCHLATMGSWSAEGQSGPIASASQGGVSASFQIPTLPAGGVTVQWYNQTPCGRTAWMLLRPYSLGGRYYGVKTFHPFG